MFVRAIYSKNPPLEITLKLSLQEAAILAWFVGNVDKGDFPGDKPSPNNIRAVTSGLWYSLTENDRVKNLAGNITRSIRASNKKEKTLHIPIGHIPMPKE